MTHADGMRSACASHACGFKLANDGHDTRALQHYFVGLAGAGKLGTTSASPSITLAASPACAANMASIAAIACSSCSAVRSLSGLLCWTLCSRGMSRVRHRKYTPGCSRRTFAMAFSPCLRKSRRSAQMTSSLSLLREPRSRPVGFHRLERSEIAAAHRRITLVLEGEDFLVAAH